jgi:pimeloyl-ACP methyl ester carboxylesterase
VPFVNSLRLARMLPGARVAVLKRSGHCPQEEIPEGFEQIVGTYLAGVLGKPAAA